MLAEEVFEERLRELFLSANVGTTINLPDVPSFDCVESVLRKKFGIEVDIYNIGLRNVDYDFNIPFKREGKEYQVDGSLRWGQADLTRYK